MADRPIDRQAWARLIAGLIASETGGKKATFARLVGVDPKTIGHWLGGTVDVSEASVRRVATALGRGPLEFLVAVGYYRAEEVGTPEPLDAEKIDEVIQIVADDPELTPRMKMTIIKRLLELEEQDRERRKEMAKWLVDRAKEAS